MCACASIIYYPSWGCVPFAFFPQGGIVMACPTLMLMTSVTLARANKILNAPSFFLLKSWSRAAEWTCTCKMVTGAVFVTYSTSPERTLTWIQYLFSSWQSSSSWWDFHQCHSVLLQLLLSSSWWPSRNKEKGQHRVHDYLKVGEHGHTGEESFYISYTAQSWLMQSTTQCC